MLDKCK
jgi:cyclin-dependent kinase 1